MSESYTALFAYLQAITPLGAQELDAVRNAAEARTIKKGDFLSEEGKVCEHIAFITKGFFRTYILQESQQVTVHLAGPGQFISSFASFLSRTPSPVYVQAVSDAEVLLLEYFKLQQLYNENQRLERVGRVVTEQYFIARDNQVVSFIRYSAEERYRMLLKEHPAFFLNIPQQYIASYLGIKPETLSRIRAKSIS